MKWFLTFVLFMCPIPALAICDTVWNADQIVSLTNGQSLYLRIPLKDINQNITEVTVAQLRTFYDAKEKISRIAGMSPSFIICGDSEPNAFAAPTQTGEVVGVTIGMLLMADGDPDIAALVVGHEIAHHVKQHIPDTRTRDAIIGFIGQLTGIALELTLGQKYNVAGLGTDVVNIGASLLSRKFSRDQEREADDLGFQYIVATGYSPQGAIALAERFRSRGQGGGGWFFDTHPGWDERAELFKSKIANLEPQIQRNRTDSTKTISLGMEFVNVPGRCFRMGDTFGDGASDERPVHEVCVSGFAIGKYEVTQGQWKKIMGNNPSHFSTCGENCPVENVSWDDVQEFIQKLNSQTGGSLRLPTEAEWEYAARSGGRREKYSGGDNIDVVAWYSGNSGGKTHPVSQKQPNGLGIYDMSGNVWEWVSDWYGKNYYSESPTINPQGPSSGTDRVFRGSSWDLYPASMRASIRGIGSPGNRIIGRLGFRLVSPLQ